MAQVEAIEQLIDVLEEHLRNSVALGRYAEAEIARSRLAELRLQDSDRQRGALQAKQLAERLTLEEVHLEGFRGMNGEWDAQLAEATQKAAELLLAMRQRHASELRDFQQRLLSRVGAPRHSKKYLDLRHVQGVLAAQKRYAAAAAIKDKADELMAVETEEWQRDVERDMLRKEQLLKVKLQAEADALNGRIAARRGELVRDRQVALERSVQRYLNVKSEVAKEHTRQTDALEAALAREESQRKTNSLTRRRKTGR